MNDIRVLVERAQNGDRTAYNHLIQRFQKMAVAYGYAKLGDRSLAEDVAQEAFLYAYRTLDQLREPAAFPGWFRRVVQGQINRHQRRQQPHFVTLETADMLSINRTSPAATLEAHEEEQEVLAAIDNLPEAQRTVIALFYIGEYSQQAISAAKGDEWFAFLVARGAKPDIGVYFWRNEPEQVRALLAADPTQANAIGVQNATPLCSVMDISMAQLLLDYGADPFFPLENTWCKEYGADTPMRWAASRPERPDFFRFLLNYTGTPIDIHLACALGDVAEVKQYLAAEPPLLEARTGATHVLLSDLTPLHVTALYRQAAIAKLLLERGANPNATTASVHKMTPLHLAVMYSAGDEDEIRVDVPQLLLAYEADLTLRDSVRQMTPLEWAEGKYMADEKGRTAVAKLLREYS